MRIRTPQQFNEKYFEKAMLEQFNQLIQSLENGRAQDLIVDLSHSEFIGPMAILDLLVLAGFLVEEYSLSVHLILPQSQSVLRFLKLRGFFSYAEHFFSFDYSNPLLREIGDENKPRESTKSTPIYKIIDTRNISWTISKIERLGFRVLNSNLGYGEYEVGRFVAVFGELCQNIPEHSEHWGFATIQAITYRGAKWVKVCVADRGIGIKNRLAERYTRFKGSDESDLTAIAYAMSPGVTRVYREMGLYSITKLVKEWHGMISIRSGTAKISISPSGRANRKDHLHWFPGTQVDVYFPQLGK